jgi:hypothetical protein
MIEINVHLKSAISRTRDKELARFVICNTGEPAPPGEGHYYVESYRGRSKVALDRRKPSRSGEVRHHRRDDEHVLNLVAKALQAMGYGLPQAARRSAARRGGGGKPVAGPPI